MVSSRQYWPTGHAEQELRLSPPVEGSYVPAGQFVGVVVAMGQ
jgi:hypothetical protein